MTAPDDEAQWRDGVAELIGGQLSSSSPESRKPDKAHLLGWLASANLSVANRPKLETGFFVREIAPNLPLIRTLEPNHRALSASR